MIKSARMSYEHVGKGGSSDFPSKLVLLPHFRKIEPPNRLTTTMISTCAHKTFIIC